MFPRAPAEEIFSLDEAMSKFNHGCGRNHRGGSAQGTVARARPGTLNHELLEGFQRNTGFLAAAVSSNRETRVECGASSAICGSSFTSSAIDFIASMNKSISSLDSLSVGSIIRAPGTISGNAVV